MSVITPATATYATYRGYVTVDDFIAAPTGTDISQLRPGAPVQDQRAAAARVILSASNAADRICQKVLAATVDTETGRHRVSSRGHLRIPLKNTPILEVRGISLGTVPTALVPQTDLSGVWIEDPIVMIPYCGDTVNGRVYGSVTYVNGWAVGTLAAPVTAGATSITLDNVLGVYPGQQTRLYDGGLDEVLTIAPSYVPGASPVTLAAPVAYDHSVGCGVSNMPPAIRQAVILLASSYVKLRGSESIVLSSINEEPSRKSAGESGMSSEEEEARSLLFQYGRVW